MMTQIETFSRDNTGTNKYLKSKKLQILISEMVYYPSISQWIIAALLQAFFSPNLAKLKMI